MPAHIRRTITHEQTTFEEGGKPVDTPTQLVAAAVVIKNPWFGQGFVDDLRTEIRDVCPGLGSVVGMAGEIEHGSALTHTLFFGNQYRDAVNAKSYLALTNTRGGASARS